MAAEFSDSPHVPPAGGWGRGERGRHFFICEALTKKRENHWTLILNDKNSLPTGGVIMSMSNGEVMFQFFFMFIYNKRQNIAMRYLIIILHSYL